MFVFRNMSTLNGPQNPETTRVSTRCQRRLVWYNLCFQFPRRFFTILKMCKGSRTNKQIRKQTLTADQRSITWRNMMFWTVLITGRVERRILLPAFLTIVFCLDWAFFRTLKIIVALLKIRTIILWLQRKRPFRQSCNLDSRPMYCEGVVHRHA